MPVRSHLVLSLLACGLAACVVPDGDLDNSAVLGLDLVASTDTLAARSTSVTGMVELGFTSHDLVTLSIEDDGVPVYAASVPADRLRIPVQALIAPLSEGTNTLVVRASHLDATATTSLVVEVPFGISDLVVGTPAVPDELAAIIDGAVMLGFDSTSPALVEVWVEGALAATTELPGLAGRAAFAVPVKLPHGGANDVVVAVTYGEARREASVTVGVAEPVAAFAVDLLSPTSPTFEAELVGQVDVGYRSERPVTFEVLADGVLVHSELVDVSLATRVPVGATVPLAHVGASSVLARVRYEGAEASETEEVSVVPVAPEVTLPGWSNNYVPSTSFRTSGAVEVLPQPEWVTTAVQGSMDGGLTWIDGTDSQAGWVLIFRNPDIQQRVLVEVETSNRGIPVRWRYEDVLPVDLIFRCLEPESMLPTNGLVQDLGTEHRTMIGYFGDPLGVHNVEFVLEAEIEDLGPYPALGTILSRGAFAVDVAFDVDPYGCGNNCVLDYTLDVLLDGASDCRADAFGQITEL